METQNVQHDHNDKIIKQLTGGDVDISDNKEIGLPEEEWNELATWLKEAYPAPQKGVLSQKVMAQIRAEKTRKQKWRSLLRRYGSVAACLVLLGGALAVVYPHFQRMSDTTMSDNEAVAPITETLAETAALEAYTDAPTTGGDATDACAVAEDSIAAYGGEGDEFAMSRSSTGVVEEAAEQEEEESVQIYSATSLLKSVSLYAAAEVNNTEDAAYDSSLADGFLHYLLNEGYFTNDEYQAWLTDRDTETVWEPQELCEAFGIDASLYDTWLRK